MTSADDEPRLSKAQKQLIGFIVVLAAVNVLYRIVYATGASQTAALYVGVPTLLAVGPAMLPRSRSTTGMVMKGSMLAVLIAAVILPEGLLCLLFVVPAIGIAAVARSLEHATLPWAVVAWIARLPLIEHVLQLVTDAVGGGPRPVDLDVDSYSR